jgi:hypothetical protein
MSSNVCASTIQQVPAISSMMYSLLRLRRSVPQHSAEASPPDYEYEVPCHRIVRHPTCANRMHPTRQHARCLVAWTVGLVTIACSRFNTATTDDFFLIIYRRHKSLNVFSPSAVCSPFTPRRNYPRPLSLSLSLSFLAFPSSAPENINEPKILARSMGRWESTFCKVQPLHRGRS